MNVNERNFGLDLLRAFSIILVLLAHRFSFNYEIGILGVQVFFVLSGFLVGQIYLKLNLDSISKHNLSRFWKRRWLRTLPLYYLILIIKMLVFGNPLGWKIIVYFFFLQANLVGIHFLGVSWSLVVEEWFYIFLPLSGFILFRDKINPGKYLAFIIATIMFFLLARLAWNYFEKGIIIYQFDCLMLGVLLAWLKMFRKSVYERLSFFVYPLIALTGVVLLTAWQGTLREIPLYNISHRVLWSFAISTCVFFIIPFCERSFLINVSLKNIRPLFLFITWTSLLTYSLYLTHMMIFQFELSQYYLNLLMHIILLPSISYMIFKYYEHPLLSMRQPFSFRNYSESVKKINIRLK